MPRFDSWRAQTDPPLLPAQAPKSRQLSLRHGYTVSGTQPNADRKRPMLTMGGTARGPDIETTRRPSPHPRRAPSRGAGATGRLHPDRCGRGAGAALRAGGRGAWTTTGALQDGGGDSGDFAGGSGALNIRLKIVRRGLRYPDSGATISFVGSDVRGLSREGPRGRRQSRGGRVAREQMEDAMVITAKFSSRCPCCQQTIAVGSKIEWSKGRPAQHVACGLATDVAIRPDSGPSVASTDGRCRKCGCACKTGYSTCYSCSSASKTCRACGHVERRNARGYVEGDWVRNGECQSCREERAMGY